MRWARKRQGSVVHAWELGSGSEMELRLITDGVIRWETDERCHLFSMEAVNGAGETAMKGDFFKVDEADGRRFAYPNRRDWFLKHHRHLEGDAYEVVSEPLPIWTKDDPPCEPVDYLLRTGRLRLDPADASCYFNAVLWDAPLSAAEDVVIVFYSLERDAFGAFQNIEFNFVDRQFFERDYILCEGME